MEWLWSIGIITMIIVALPCLLVRPLFIAIADRIAGKQHGTKELQDLKLRIETLEHELRTVRVQVISIENTQEFSTKLLEDLKSQKSKEVKQP